MYPEDVGGMVLVDPTHDSQQSDGASGSAGTRILARTLDQARASHVPTGIPFVLIDAVIHAGGAIRHRSDSRGSSEQPTGSTPSRWIRPVAGHDPWRTLVVTNRSGHNVAQEQPELVVETVRRVVDEATQQRARR